MDHRSTRRALLREGAGLGMVGAADLLGAKPGVMLTLTPTSGAPGTAVAVSGSGFGRKQTVTLAWDGVTVQTTQSNRQGRFSATVIAPSTAGARTLAASSPIASSTGVFTVVVVAPPPPPPPTAGVAAPIPPSTYAIPSGAQLVTDGSSLDAALALAAHDIVLADGLYDKLTYFSNVNGSRVYAANLGMAVFRSGLTIGGNWGPGGGLIQGALFDVQDPTKTLQNASICIWGTGKNSIVRDVTLRGHNTLNTGIFAPCVDGLVIQRVDLQDYLADGIRATTNGGPSGTTPMLIEDIYGRHCMATVQASLNGTAESILWVGNPATVRRIRLRDGGWMGLWTGGQFADSILEDVDIDGSVNGPSVGYYLEHYSVRSTLRRFVIGPTVRTGINCEWNELGPGTGASKDMTFEDGRIESKVVGLNMDAGTERTTIRRTAFVGQCWAAIADNLGIGNLADTSGNDYSGLPAGVPQIRKDQNLNTATCG